MGFNIRGRFKERKYSYQKNRKNKNKKEQMEIEKNKNCLLRHIIKSFEEIDEKYWLTCNILYSENRFAKKWLN